MLKSQLYLSPKDLMFFLVLVGNFDQLFLPKDPYGGHQKTTTNSHPPMMGNRRFPKFPKAITSMVSGAMPSLRCTFSALSFFCLNKETGQSLRVWRGGGVFFFLFDSAFISWIQPLKVFPERRFVAGFFRRLLAYLTPHISHTYLTPHISHTYPSHHTYPTHIHSKRIPPIRIPPIRIRSTRIPPVRIHAMRIHSKRLHQQVLQYVSHQYVSHQYVSHQHVSHQYVSMLCVSIQCVSIQKVCISRNRKTYPTNTYPTNTYLQHVSHQYGSIQCVSIQKVCISRNGNEYEYHCISFHTIATRREW